MRQIEHSAGVRAGQRQSARAILLTVSATTCGVGRRGPYLPPTTSGSSARMPDEDASASVPSTLGAGADAAGRRECRTGSFRPAALLRHGPPLGARAGRGGRRRTAGADAGDQYPLPAGLCASIPNDQWFLVARSPERDLQPGRRDPAAIATVVRGAGGPGQSGLPTLPCGPPPRED